MGEQSEHANDIASYQEGPARIIRELLGYSQGDAAALDKEVQRLREEVALLRKPVTFAETDKALATVKREVESTAAWLTDPLYLAKLFSTIIKDRVLK